MQWSIIFLFAVCVGCSSPVMDDEALTTSAVIHAGWQVVNDTVMGGVSSSDWSVSNEGFGAFSGDVSLENYGGFASVRGGAPRGHFGTAESLKVRLKGDGKVYKFCLRTPQMGSSVSYQHNITTTGEWQDVVLPLNAFVARWRGRMVSDAQALQAADISGVGFLIADKQAGPFSLVVAEIEPVEE